MPTPMERAPEPGLEYVPIPKTRYTSPEYAREEWDAMWTKTWVCAGRESDLARPGDYVTLELGRESILIVRQPDQSLVARYNVCMHRGNRLREPGRGHASKFACLFHGWEYGLDGSLQKALDPQCFKQGLDRSKLDLRPVQVDTWAGFVFVNLDPQAGPLRDYLGVVPQHLDPYHFENWKISFDATIEIECNWKTCVDAFNEAYHLAATHTWTLEFSDDTRTLYDCYDRHTRMLFPEVQASLRHPGANTVTPGIKEMFLKRVGIDVERFEGDWQDARKVFAEQQRKLAVNLGADLSDLNESQLCDDFHYTVFPNMTFNTHALFTWVFWHRPHPTDPNKMSFDFIELMNAPAIDIPRPEKQRFSTAAGDTLAGKCNGGDLIDEDLYNLPRIQAGMNSAAFQDLHLCTQEVRILHFHKTLEDYLERGRSERARAGTQGPSHGQPQSQAGTRG